MALKAQTAMTAERAERLELAQAIEEQQKNPRNVAKRAGGIYKSSGGTYVDAHGKAIPGDELPEGLRPKPAEVGAPGEAGKVKAGGADVEERSGKDKRDKGARS